MQNHHGLPKSSRILIKISSDRSVSTRDCSAVLTISEAFHRFASGLELTEPQRRNASEQHVQLREKLQKHLHVTENFLSGSYARHTAIRPLNDIDVVVVLRNDRPQSVPFLRPTSVLKTVQNALEAAYPGKTATKQARSVNIEFSGSGISYDIVPAYVTRPDVYRIPDREAGTWIETNPKLHANLSTHANERAGKCLKPLLKAIKQANSVAKKPARSFHLEVLSWCILDHKPSTWIDGLCTLVAGLKDAALKPCPDPAGLGPDIQPSMSKCRATERWLSSVHRTVEHARELDHRGQRMDAHGLLREVFGPQWPTS